MKHILKSTKEEKAKFIFICNRGEFLVKSKETKQSVTLVVKEEVFSTEISEMKLEHVEEPKSL